jgi:5-methylcytosine-specific restriction endonuclease McrA
MNYADYLRSPAWQDRRAAALIRAGNRCQVCNSDKRLDVHHRDYSRLGREANGDLTVLCRTCHARHHKARHWSQPAPASQALKDAASRLFEIRQADR